MNKSNSAPPQFYFSHNLSGQPRWYTDREKVGSYESAAYAIWCMELNKTNTVLSFTFSCRLVKTKSKRTFNFCHHAGSFCLTGQATSFGCSYVSANSNAAYMSGVKGTFWNRVSNGVNSGYCFWNLIKFKTLNKKNNYGQCIIRRKEASVR